jgi:hypothetical protein
MDAKQQTNLDPRRLPGGSTVTSGNANYYNTGKVLIGVAYKKPLPALTREGEFMQAVLLGERPAQYWSTWRYAGLVATTLLAVIALSMIVQAVVG